jgi:hypothetical protein
MTKALQDAFEAASHLPEGKQDALASAILEELSVEKLWDASLSGSIGVIESLADEALAEHRSGKTEPLDPDKL